MKPASASSCLEVHVAHAAVVLLLGFVDELSAWAGAEDASCTHPRSESDRREARRRSERYAPLEHPLRLCAQLCPAPCPVTSRALTLTLTPTLTRTRYAKLYPAPSPATGEAGSKLALGGAEAYYLVALEDVQPQP